MCLTKKKIGILLGPLLLVFGVRPGLVESQECALDIARRIRPVSVGQVKFDQNLMRDFKKYL